MIDYEDIRRKVLKFLHENDISAFDLCRVAKDLCNCRTCKFFVQHYSKDGQAVDFGHCIKSNIPTSKRPNTQSCGFWAFDK